MPHLADKIGFATYAWDRSQSGHLMYGYEFYVDFASIGASLLSLGIAERQWEARREAELRGVGMDETKLYDPGSWVSSTPAYVPIYVADRFDNFWASIKFEGAKTAKVRSRKSREIFQFPTLARLALSYGESLSASHKLA